MHGENVTAKRQTKVGKQIRVRNLLRRNPKMLKMHRLLLNCDNHAQKGEMQQSHEHRCGIHKKNSGHNPDGSKTESPAMAELKLHSHPRCGKLRFNHLPHRPHKGLGLKVSFMYRDSQVA